MSRFIEVRLDSITFIISFIIKFGFHEDKMRTKKELNGPLREITNNLRKSDHDNIFGTNYAEFQLHLSPLSESVGRLKTLLQSNYSERVCLVQNLTDKINYGVEDI